MAFSQRFSHFPIWKWRIFNRVFGLFYTKAELFMFMVSRPAVSSSSTPNTVKNFSLWKRWPRNENREKVRPWSHTFSIFPTEILDISVIFNLTYKKKLWPRIRHTILETSATVIFWAGKFEFFRFHANFFLSFWKKSFDNRKSKNSMKFNFPASKYYGSILGHDFLYGFQ